VALEGGDQLEYIRWRNSQTGQTEEHKIHHAFILTGVTPNTSWLDDCVELDAKGFIKTGPDLSRKFARCELAPCQSAAFA
jgi:thioredoxin reductase (NADPH)